ncbi:hypothetical protein [Motilimonas cestriensis]|uniref:hypothetical protein n=1 Tax=Motilimonas cestriensis TaxID=2742685 RepID=UPI001E4C2F37|nr:hypothetical protein [Motilimonas cestriensis]
MSTGPSWITKAENNTEGNEVGQAAEIDNKKPRGKPGRKKSIVDRKVVGLNFSDAKSNELNQLEMRLKLEGLELTRGRSEAAELAIYLLNEIFKGSMNDGVKTMALALLNEECGAEDRSAEENEN